MTITKSEISEYLFKTLKLNKKDSKKIVKIFFEEMRIVLESGEQIKLSGFGNFYIRNKKQRPGRNPKTGKNIPIAARRVVIFKPGKKLKNLVECTIPKK